MHAIELVGDSPGRAGSEAFGDKIVLAKLAVSKVTGWLDLVNITSHMDMNLHFVPPRQSTLNIARRTTPLLQEKKQANKSDKKEKRRENK